MVPLAILSLLACLERVTDAPVPLDPRFHEGHEEQGNAQGGNTAGSGSPWADVSGEKAPLEVIVEGTEDVAVQLDVGVYDASLESRTRRVGSLQLPGPGSTTLQVPTTVTRLSLQAFQDPAGDGPGDDDPFALADVDLAMVGGKTTLKLVVGARGVPSGGGGGGPQGNLAPPGAPGGDPQGGGGTPGGAPRSGESTLQLPSGATSKVLGKVNASRDLSVVLDVFTPDAQAPGGRTFRGRVSVQRGDFSVEVSRSWGRIELEAYQDLTGDSRSGDDPAVNGDRVLDVSQGDVSGITLTIP
jgi:hypothetical protein